MLAVASSASWAKLNCRGAGAVARTIVRSASTPNVADVGGGDRRGRSGATDEPSVDAGLGRHGWAAVGLITLLTAVVILPGIGRKSLWRDEGFSTSTVLRPWGSFFRLLMDHESNGVTYSVLLRAWSELGSSEGSLRTLSALAVLASIPLVALVGLALADRTVGVVAALLLALHGSVFAYGQMIRAYSFVVLFAVMATLLLVRDVRRPSNRLLVGWVVASLMLTYTNLVAAALVVCQVASLVALPASERQWRRRLTGAGVVIALTLPLGLLVTSHEEGGLFEFGLGTLWDVLMVTTGRSGFAGIVGFAVLGVLALRTTIHLVRSGGPPFAALGARPVRRVGRWTAPACGRRVPRRADPHRPLHDHVRARHRRLRVDRAR